MEHLSFELFGKGFEVDEDRRNLTGLTKVTADVAKRLYDYYPSVYKVVLKMLDRGEFDGDVDIQETVYNNILSLAATDCGSKAVDGLYGFFNTERILGEDRDAFLSEYYSEYQVGVFKTVMGLFGDFFEARDALRERIGERKRRDPNYVDIRFDLMTTRRGGGLPPDEEVFARIPSTSAETKEAENIVKRFRAIIESPKTVHAIASAIYDSALKIPDALKDLQEVYDEEIIEFIDDDDIEEAEELFTRLKKGSVSDDERFEAYVEILELNPYEETYYQYMIDTNGDKDNEIAAIADFFGIDILSYKVSLVRSFMKKQSFSSIESALGAKDIILEYCNFLGLTADRDDDGTTETTLNEINKDVDTKIQDAKINSAKKLLDSLPKGTEEEALATKEKLVEYCKEIELSENNPAIHSINSTLQQIDKEIRTVEGIEFPTRELAHTARAEHVAIEEFLSTHGNIYRGDLLAILAEINSGKFVTAIKDVYAQTYTTYLSEFDKKLEKAKHYEYKQTTGKKFTGFKNLLKDVTSALGGKGEQTAWEELTQNGQYSLDVVGSDSTSGIKVNINLAEPKAQEIATQPPQQSSFNKQNETSKPTVEARQTASSVQPLKPKTSSGKEDKDDTIAKVLSSINTAILSIFTDESKIPPKKLTNAKNTFLSGMNPSEKIYIFFDSTLFGSAKEGFALTSGGFYYKNSFEDAGFAKMSDIVGATPEGNYIVVSSGNRQHKTILVSEQSAVATAIQSIANVLNGGTPIQNTNTTERIDEMASEMFSLVLIEALTGDTDNEFVDLILMELAENESANIESSDDITSNIPLVLAENISHDTATEYKEKFRLAGAVVQIEKMSSLNSQTAPVASTISVADELVKFKGLLDAGVLTQEEFDKKKAELLNL